MSLSKTSTLLQRWGDNDRRFFRSFGKGQVMQLLLIPPTQLQSFPVETLSSPLLCFCPVWLNIVPRLAQGTLHLQCTTDHEVLTSAILLSKYLWLRNSLWNAPRLTSDADNTATTTRSPWSFDLRHTLKDIRIQAKM